MLRGSLSKEGQDARDLLGEAFDLKKPQQETSMELEAVNLQYDSSSIDVINIQSILMSTGTDFAMKKACLEQLTLVLFDLGNKRPLFKSQLSPGSRDLLGFLVNEVLTSQKTCLSYARQQTAFLELSQQTYIGECLRFLFYSALLHSEEPEVAAFFSKRPADTFEPFLTATLFFAGAASVRAQALKALFVSTFQPVLLGFKVQKQQMANGAMRKSLSVQVAEFCAQSFVMIVPCIAQRCRAPLREELLLTEE